MRFTFRGMDFRPCFFSAREWMSTQGLLDLSLSLMLALVVPVLVATVSFFFGGRVQSWMFWVGLVPSFVLTGMCSWKRTFVFAAVVAVACLGAAYIFAYGSWDSAVCHWAQTRAMLDGWNPVLAATNEQIEQVVGKDTCSIAHILCAPKFPSTSAAIAASGLDLFSGLGFADTMLFFLCLLVGFRFLRNVVGASVHVAFMAALLMAMPLELMRQTLQGYVDYIRYTTVIVAVFSYLLWRKTGRYSDLLLFLLGFIVAACSKSGALLWLVIAFVAALVRHFKSQVFRRTMLGAIVVFAILGTAPYLTEWIHNGSPFYPAHTFDSGKTVLDLCGDMVSPSTRNPDALRMGWLARVVYAWVSQDLAIAACRWWYSAPDFHPVFKSPYVNGLSDGFTHWLWFCGAAFCLIRNRYVLAVGGFTVAMILLLPTRYVGFYRYTPEIVILPPLCLAALTQITIPIRRLSTIFRVGVAVLLGYMCVFALLFALSWFGLQFGLEAARQHALNDISKGHSGFCLGMPLASKIRYLCDRRVAMTGLARSLHPSETAAVVYFAPPETFDLGLIPASSINESRRKRSEQIREKPIFFSYYNSVFSFARVYNRWRIYQFDKKDIPMSIRSK